MSGLRARTSADKAPSSYLWSSYIIPLDAFAFKDYQTKVKGSPSSATLLLQTDAIIIIINRVVAPCDRWWLGGWWPLGPRGCAMGDLPVKVYSKWRTPVDYATQCKGKPCDRVQDAVETFFWVKRRRPSQTRNTTYVFASLQKLCVVADSLRLYNVRIWNVLLRVFGVLRYFHVQ